VAKTKVKAKGKVKREQEATDAEKIQKKLDDQIEVKEVKSQAKNSDVPSKDMINVVADSLERLWTEKLDGTRHFSGEDQMRLSAEEGARVIVGSLMYGIGPYGRPVRIREDDSANFKFCKEHN